MTRGSVFKEISTLKNTKSPNPDEISLEYEEQLKL